MGGIASDKKLEERARRMALRRDLGNRAPAAAKSTRGCGGAYLVAHACFACRKSFKVAPRPARELRCPCCSAALYEMGRAFKAPPSRNLAQWKKVQALYAAGFRFFSYRGNDGPPLPSQYSQVAAFVRDYPEHPLRIAPARQGRPLSPRPAPARAGM
ncbi:hypothetical protein [Pseudoxanthomonas composti]|uniref:Uncharacterized protein n=1 Tax=Pseudoxanthomonas composti TaxID=2137479 RepID=A0A4Q1JYC3_9GAMM|nr:hypothetical protein [Pseudoxanthomonas composti]RXR07360.1 hypothetical protein EPA99_05435 [Pseudoxanthomonas composti]